MPVVETISETIETSHTGRFIDTDELLALPDDGTERWIIRGELREIGMIRRSYSHSWRNARIVTILQNWLDAHPAIGGRVVCGEAGFQLAHDPDTTVGTDVAYIDRATAEATREDQFLIDGPPVLAVEILSSSDRMEDVSDKIDVYLKYGTKLVWVMDPWDKTLTAYRPDAQPRMYNLEDTIPPEASLPGLVVSVRELFA